MTRAKLNEETIKRLPVPARGNRITYFAGATIQGSKAPRGFGVLCHGCWCPRFHPQLSPPRQGIPLHDRRMAGLVRP